MRLKCTKCSHDWETRKDKISVLCPYCKTSTFFHKPIVIKK